MRVLVTLLLVSAIRAQDSAPQATKRDGATTAPTSAALAQAGLQAFHRGAFTTAAYFLSQAVALEPKHKWAWNDLCMSYFELDKLDAAVNACLAQIDANPESPTAYNNLGRAYWRKEQRDEAIAAFREQIEVNPQDRFAHGNLGNLYCELQRYSEAVPELEKAVAIDPANASHQAGLGDAYLGTGKAEKGLEVLNKLVQDKPSPATWNNVAYKLASHNVQLEKAQQYAESAVTTEEIALRNAEVDHITAATLRRVVSLAHAWDTLGWVHFRRGNPDEAGKFLEAAWRLSQCGPCEDHAGQLDESLGRKQEAIQAYARALAAHGAPPQTRARLAALVDAEKIEPLVQRAGDELVAMRTINAGRLPAEKATAEFYVAKMPAPGSAEAQFIRGDDKLSQFAKVVGAAVPGVFPDSTPTKLIRRVTLTCPGGGGECVLELLPAPAAVTAELNSIRPDTNVPSEPSREARPGVYRSGDGITPPSVLYKVEPHYSDQASKAGLEGTVVLYMEVGPSGQASNIRVVRGLGLGLDEKAMEAVSQWQFQPGMKDGQPVTVTVTIEVNFRLMKNRR